MPSFILQNMEEILRDWEQFARSLTPAADKMDSLALRDHAKEMLEAIAKDIKTAQTDRERDLKAKGLKVLNGIETAAAVHGALRHQGGFDLAQLVAEFRALRASVLKIWIEKEGYGDAETAYEMARFNEGIDQALAESVTTFSKELTGARDTFLAILGHDLRTPLGAISNVLPILAQSQDAAQREKALATGRRSVSAMAAMIRDLLEYTRTRLGKGIPVVPAPGSLDELCKAAVNEVSAVFPQTSFRYESSGMLEGVFAAERMHQAISNLLTNAVEHGRRGTPVTLIAAGDANGHTIRVINIGPPIAPADLEAVFEPMQQGGQPGDGPRRSTNVGLGLFIAREIVRAHGGTLEASSSDRGETVFTVKLPRA